MDHCQSSSRRRWKPIDEVVHHRLWRTWRGRRAYKGRAKPALAGVVVAVGCILDISSCLNNHVSTWSRTVKCEKHVPLKRNPLVWSLWSFFARSAQSPSKIALQPSNRESCRLKSCSIFINAGFRPGISSPFLMRRINRIGSIPAPTFSSSPRIKAGKISDTPR